MIHLPFRFDGKRHRVQDKIIEEAQVAKGIEVRIPIGLVSLIRTRIRLLQEARHSGYVAGYVTGLVSECDLTISIAVSHRTLGGYRKRRRRSTEWYVTQVCKRTLLRFAFLQAPGGREEVNVNRAVSVQSASGSTRPPASVSQHEAVAVSATGDNRTKETGDGQTKETGTAGLTQSAARGTNEASTAKGGAGSAITAPARRNAVCLPNTKSRMLSGRGREWINFLALGDDDSDEPPTKILPRVSTLVLRRSGLMDGRRWVS